MPKYEPRRVDDLYRPARDDEPDTFDDVRRATQLVRREDYATYEEWNAAVIERLHPVNRMYVAGDKLPPSRVAAGDERRVDKRWTD